jgi:dTDP-4-dehydrorhamnose reductase
VTFWAAKKCRRQQIDQGLDLMRNVSKIKVLILGASGMLGNAMLRFFAQSPEYEVVGSVRSAAALRRLPEAVQRNIIVGVEVENADSLTKLLAACRPNVVINCIGLVKQLAEAEDPLVAIPINSLLPHRLARLCDLSRARLIHISTDCVFAGTKGLYVEGDAADSDDLYGRSKYLGEVDAAHAVTLRTSIIGHELSGANGLVGWFLSRHGSVKGYTRAIFSGLPTVELARVVRDQVIPRPELRGLYHISVDPINKFELLKLVAQVYGRSTEIVSDNTVQVDRSLDSSRFRSITGYTPPTWRDLVESMHRFG